MQVTYNGWPLYRYSQDAQPGDAIGQAVGDVWFVVSSGGEAVRPAPAPASAPTPAAAQQPAQSGTQAPVPAPAQPAAPSARVIQVTASNFSFSPRTISVRQGERVQFSLANRDGVPHTFSFSLPGSGYDVVAQGGASSDGAVVSVASVGRIEFFCQFHASMIGSLEVGAGSAGASAPADPYAN